MRVFVFLLVLANLVFLAWTQGYFGQMNSPDAVRLEQQVAPERLKILSREASPLAGSAAEMPNGGNSGEGSLPKLAEAAAEKPVAVPGAVVTAGKAVDSTPESPVEKAVDKPGKKQATQLPEPAPASKGGAEKCTAWRGLSTADSDAIDAILAGERFSALRRVRQSIPEKQSWWVFIPPLASKTDAERKAGELRRLGVTDYFVVQEPKTLRHAISLGVFSTEQAADAHLEGLRGKGVRSARVDQRPGGGVIVEVTGAGNLVDALVDAVRQALPEIRRGTCGKQ